MSASGATAERTQDAARSVDCGATQRPPLAQVSRVTDVADAPEIAAAASGGWERALGRGLRAAPAASQTRRRRRCRLLTPAVGMAREALKRVPAGPIHRPDAGHSRRK